MRYFRFAVVAVSLVITAGAALAASATEIQQSAAQHLQQALGTRSSLSTARDAAVLNAFEQIATAHPAEMRELAGLIAAARPDLLTELKAALAKINPPDLPEAVRFVEQSALNPTIDQLATLARLEGSAPAAGIESAFTSDLHENVDLGWVNPTAGGNGSPE